MLILANDLQKTSLFLEDAGLYPTIAFASCAVFLLAYLVRAVENYIRHLHHKSYLPYSQPRFVLAVAGYTLIADSFIIGGVFPNRVPLWVGTVTLSAGVLCLIISIVMSLLPYFRQPPARR